MGTDNNVTLYIHKCEMGQGTVTSLSMLLAEELECDWSKIRPAFPGVDRAYGQQMVVGSQSIRGSYNSLRQAGAQARTMLVQAAAQKWGVDPAQCRAENSFVINTASNARVSFGDVAEDASKLPVPARVTLKDASQFQIIGKPRKRLDTPSKSNGSAKFGLDARVPGMSFAVVSRCAVFGGKVAKFDATAAKAVAGVKNVVEIPSGIAVIADNTWNAMQGRKALNVTWDEGPRANISSASMRAEWKSRAENPGAVARNDGDAAGAIASASRKLEAVYEVPYLAHAPMEPLNCTASVTADSCEVWVSSQGQTGDQQAAMRITGLPADKVKINSLYMGGGFGRRARTDYVEEAVHISKTIGAPVQLVWTREDDMQQDAYRPASYTRFWGALDADGWPAAFSSRVVCPPFGGGGAISRVAIEGIVDSPYAIPNFHVEYHDGDVAPDKSVVAGIPVSYWRSVGYSQNVFFNEGFMDELAALGKKDPLEMRRRLLAKNPRALAVLEIAATKAGWGKPLPKGHGRGIAVGQQHRQLYRPGRRSVRDQRQAAHPQSSLRRGLRPAGQPLGNRAADPERHRLRPQRRAQRRHHHRQGPRAAGQLQQLRSAAHRRNAAGRSTHRTEHGEPRRYWRSQYAPDRRSRRQRYLRRDGQTHPQATNPARRLSITRETPERSSFSDPPAPC